MWNNYFEERTQQSLGCPGTDAGDTPRNTALFVASG